VDRYILSVLVENRAGVLSRVSGLFSRRSYNIDSLSVSETEDPEISRMTIAVRGDQYIFDQVRKQLNKLIDVIKITELKPDRSVYRELALVKVNAAPENRSAIGETAEIFRGKIVDVASETLTVEITGDVDKITAFIELMKPYGIKEMARTGLTALERGNNTIS